MKIYAVDYKEYIKNMEEKDVVLVDPPWNYDDKPLKVRKQLNYSLWDNDVGFLFENVKTKYLLIWTTNSFIEKVFHDYFGSAHEFEYKTIITWVKVTKRNKIFYGLGNHFRNATEHILVFAKKKVRPIRLPIRNVFLAKTGERTIKPKKFEVSLFKEFEKKNYKKFAYIFCGCEVKCFQNFDIDLVDICLGEVYDE